jgi:hypothetical protein
MRRAGPGRRRGHVAEPELVDGPAPGRFSCVDGGLSFFGRDDPHTLDRLTLR